MLKTAKLLTTNSGSKKKELLGVARSTFTQQFPAALGFSEEPLLSTTQICKQ
jgi:hypothetical protein